MFFVFFVFLNLWFWILWFWYDYVKLFEGFYPPCCEKHFCIIRLCFWTRFTSLAWELDCWKNYLSCFNVGCDFLFSLYLLLLPSISSPSFTVPNSWCPYYNFMYILHMHLLGNWHFERWSFVNKNNHMCYTSKNKLSEC